MSELGDTLEKLNIQIHLELFSNLLETNQSKIAKGKKGREPYDYVIMFKFLILKRYYNTSDDQINDRMSFIRFLNLIITNDVPDRKKVWDFRKHLLLVLLKFKNKEIMSLKKLRLKLKILQNHVKKI